MEVQMNERIPKVLIVEDDVVFQGLLKIFLEDKVEVISAFTLAEAEQKFAADRSNFSAIVMDACLEKRTPDTLALTRKIRETFKGPMVASSASPEYQKELMKAGCDHEICYKDDLPEKLLTILCPPK